MADQTLQILIETLKKGEGGKLTIEEQKDLATQLEKTATAAEKSADRQVAAEKKIAAAKKESATAIPPTFHEQAEKDRQAKLDAIRAQRRRAREDAELKGEGGGHNPAALTRHFGAVLGNAVGFPGLGMLAASGGGMAAAGIAITSLIEGLKKWNEQINAITEASRAFDSVGQRIDTLASHTQRLVHHNQAFAFSYADLARQVHSVAREIQYMVEMEELGIAMEGRMEDAAFRRTTAQVNLEQMHNPIERARQLEALEEEHYQRQMQRERAQDQARLAAEQLRQQRAEEREQRYTQEAHTLRGQIPRLSQNAEQESERAAAVQQETALRRSAIEAERAIVNEIALGNFDEFTLARYGSHRATASNELNPSSSNSDALLGTIVPAGLTRTRSVSLAAAQQFAQQRLAELDAAATANNTYRSNARMGAGNADARLRQAERRLETRESEILQQHETAESARLDAEHIQQENEIRERARLQAEEDERARMRIDLQRDIRQAIPAGSIPFNAGGVSLDNPEILQALQTIARNSQIQTDIWTTGGAAAG